MSKNYYDILEIPKNSDDNEIKRRIESWL